MIAATGRLHQAESGRTWDRLRIRHCCASFVLEVVHLSTTSAAWCLDGDGQRLGGRLSSAWGGPGERERLRRWSHGQFRARFRQARGAMLLRRRDWTPGGSAHRGLPRTNAPASPAEIDYWVAPAGSRPGVTCLPPTTPAANASTSAIWRQGVERLTRPGRSCLQRIRIAVGATFSRRDQTTSRDHFRRAMAPPSLVHLRRGRLRPGPGRPGVIDIAKIDQLLQREIRLTLPANALLIVDP